MDAESWAYSYPTEIMICDSEGVILDMNETAIGIYENEGGIALIGQNIFDHHFEPVRSHVKSMVGERKRIIYTTEKNGNKKLVNITPWNQGNNFAGFVLFTIDLPAVLSNINKDKK